MARIRTSSLAVLLLAVLARGALAGTSQQRSAIETESDEALLAEKKRPVTKVINMLKDMVEQLEKEGEEDEEVYEKMGCFCETNDKEKTKSIADDEDKISELSSSIEEITAKSAQLTAEIAQLQKEVAANSQALESATSLREKQLAEFTAEEKDMTASITGLKGAVVALSKHHEGAAALLQEGRAARRSSLVVAAAEIQRQLHRHPALLAPSVPAPQRARVISLLQSGARAAEPQSGEIFGILQAMKESFETNLGQSQKEEMENVKAYADLKKAKEEEVKAGTELLEAKQQEVAEADEKNAQSKQDLEDTRGTLAAATEFLMELKEKCQNVDHEYEERTKTRQLEIQATSKALEFLSSDEAHALFTRTFNPALIQLRATSAKQAAVASLLSVAAEKTGDRRLASLAVRSRVQKFAEVRKSIESMIDSLAQQKKADQKQKDFCVEEFHRNAMQTDEKTHEKKSLEAKIDDLKMLIKQLDADIVTLKAEITELERQLKQAGEDREKQNREFQVTIADQRATQKLLKAALGVLKGFYDKAALIQLSTTTRFKTHEKSGASGGVMDMMQTIIDEAKALEEEAARDEADGQKAYEAFVADTNASIDAMTKDVTSKTEGKAKAEADQVQAEAELEAALDGLSRLEAEVTDLHKECDWLMKNFATTNEARDSEMDALKQALGIFSQGSFAAFLQFELPTSPQ